MGIAARPRSDQEADEVGVATQTCGCAAASRQQHASQSIPRAHNQCPRAIERRTLKRGASRRADVDLAWHALEECLHLRDVALTRTASASVSRGRVKYPEARVPQFRGLTIKAGYLRRGAQEEAQGKVISIISVVHLARAPLAPPLVLIVKPVDAIFCHLLLCSRRGLGRRHIPRALEMRVAWRALCGRREDRGEICRVCFVVRRWRAVGPCPRGTAHEGGECVFLDYADGLAAPAWCEELPGLECEADLGLRAGCKRPHACASAGDAGDAPTSKSTLPVRSSPSGISQ